MGSEINPDLVLIARNFRGLSQTEVSSSAVIDQGYYSRIERGLLNAPVKDSTLKALSSALDFPVEFFFANTEVGGLPLSIHGPQWRKRSGAGAKDVKRLHAELNVRLFHLQKLLQAVDLHPELPLPEFDCEGEGGAEKVASAVRRAWGLPDGPIRNLTNLCERAGIIVIHCPFPEKIDGVTMRHRGLPPVIFLNDRAPADRMRHSLAHELGHVIMHRIPTGSMEEEADEFAGEFLAPFRLVRREFIGGRVSLDRLVQQKLYWRVSVAALLYKLGKREFITENQRSYLWRQYSAKGWRSGEPAETQFPHENAAMHSYLISYHTDELNYSISEMGRMLASHSSDLFKLYGLQDTSSKRTSLRVVK